MAAERDMLSEDVHRLAAEGDPRAIALFEEFGWELGHAVLVLLYAYDPELVVLGGSISRAMPLFERTMRERLRGYSWPHALERLRLVGSAIENGAVLGAAALYLDASNGGGDR